MCKLQSYERSPKRCCDSQAHLWTTIPTLLALSCARSEGCSQSAAGMSQAANTMCCSRAQLLWSPARRLIPGYNPLLLTGCSRAGRSRKACEYSCQCSSPEQWMHMGNAEQEFALPPSRVFAASLVHRTLDLIFIIINSRYKRNQTCSSTTDSHTTALLLYISEMTGRFSPDRFVWRFLTQGGHADILQEQEFFKTENLPRKLRLWSGISQTTLQTYYYLAIIMSGWGSPL